MADQNRFFVQIENASGTKQGSGPLTSVSRWRYTSRLDRAGSIDFAFAAADAQADQATATRIARAYALLDDEWVEVGAGLIDNRTVVPDNSGRVTVEAYGRDLIGELSFRSVGDLEVGEGSGATLAASLTTIGAVASGQGWTLTPSGTADNDYFYQRFGGESVLGALVLLADRSQTHFYRATDRTLTFTSTWADSGIRAIQAPLDDDLSADQCAIVDLQQDVDSHELLTRIIPYGGGQGAARLTLAATNRTAPAGYTLDAANNYIQAASAHSAYGLRDHPEVEFKDITPISNTDADLQAAANMLFDAALEELKRRSTLVDQRTYRLRVAGCQALLRPMQTVRVVYRDVDQGIDIDEDLYILEATWQVNEDGIGTTNLVVSTQDRWPQNDATVVSERIAEGRVFQAHPQMNANSYVIAYTKRVDIDENAAFRFRFGNEVVSLQQVVLDFQLLQFESTLKSIGTSSGGAVLATDGPSTDTTNSGGVTTTGTGGASETGSAAPNTGSATPAIGDATPTIGSATPAIGSAAPTTGSASGETGSASSGDTGGSGTLTASGTDAETGERLLSIDSTSLDTGSPQGGDVVSGGQHGHGVDVGITGSGPAVHFNESGSFSSFYVASGLAGRVPVTISGDHTHDVGSHTHSIPGHTHGVNTHTHTTTSHTHTIGSHTHTTGTHTHTTSTHTHTTAAHNHTIALHNHTIATHTHTIATHTHTTASHTHGLSQHTHSLSNHTHDLSESIIGVYGIFRDASVNTFTLTDLEYRVNSGSWAALSGAVTTSGDWYQLDISDDVINSTTFRPVQVNNLVEIRGSGNAESIAQVEGDGTYTAVYVPDGTLAVVGGDVTIAGTTNWNGTYTVDSITDSGSFDLIFLTPARSAATEFTGTMTPDKRATIDAQLSVRNVIQAIAYA